MNRSKLVLIITTISIILGFNSCGNPSSSKINSDDNIKNDIIGKWVHIKTVYKTIDSWKDRSGSGESDTSITFNIIDTIEIMEITQNKIIINFYNSFYSTDFYTKREFPYVISGNRFLGQSFSGSNNYDENNFERWKTYVNITDSTIIIHSDYKMREGNQEEWEGIEYNDTYHYSPYSGIFPHPSWPDSCVVDSRNSNNKWSR